MSKMGHAVQWIQENNLQNDPNALEKYIKHGHTEYKIKQKKNTKSISNTRSLTATYSETFLLAMYAYSQL